MRFIIFWEKSSSRFQEKCYYIYGGKVNALFRKALLLFSKSILIKVIKTDKYLINKGELILLVQKFKFMMGYIDLFSFRQSTSSRPVKSCCLRTRGIHHQIDSRRSQSPVPHIKLTTPQHSNKRTLLEAPWAYSLALSGQPLRRKYHPPVNWPFYHVLYLNHILHL